MAFESQRSVPANHPSLPGHFPGEPIVPAVVILEEITAALAQWNSDYRLAGIRTVKFLAPLRPDQLFTIALSWRHDSDDEVDVSCGTEDGTIVQGRLLVRRQPI
jgi:3-hydroxyacyl-[acyl-carrier-protein] dehydratase